jgi:hypothetical protein
MSHAWYTFSATASRTAPLADLLVGNRVTANAVAWSLTSIVFQLGGTGAVLFFFARDDWFGPN